jgi:hypothetical protein
VQYDSGLLAGSSNSLLVGLLSSAGSMRIDLFVVCLYACPHFREREQGRPRAREAHILSNPSFSKPYMPHRYRITLPYRKLKAGDTILEVDDKQVF